RIPPLKGYRGFKSLSFRAKRGKKPMRLARIGVGDLNRKAAPSGLGPPKTHRLWGKRQLAARPREIPLLPMALMTRFLIPFAFLLTLFSSERVEIYEDWQPDARGNAFDSRIIAALEQKGYSARRWDRKAHEPFLLTWKRVKTWVDFK